MFIQIRLLKTNLMKNTLLSKWLIIVFLFFIINTNSFSQNSWRFAVISDTHVGSSDTLSEMIPFLLNDSIDCLLFPGDIVEGGLACSGTQLTSQLSQWKNILAPIYAQGIGVYPIRGNHESDAHNNLIAWNSFFSNENLLPANGPSVENNLTYSFTNKNALFIGLDNYVNIHTVNQTWLNQQLSLNDKPNVFVFGHEPAFKVFHNDCLDDSTSKRGIFWQSLSQYGVKVYFCGHDHFVDVSKIDDGDGNSDNDIYQYLVGTGGGWLMSQYSNYNGINSTYTPNRIFHNTEHGYALVEINGDGGNDCLITITWKERVWNQTTSNIEYNASSNIIQYSSCETNELNEILRSELDVSFQNPVTDICNIQLNKEYKQIHINIYNSFGSHIKEFNISNSKSANINLIDIPKGFYFMSLIVDGKSIIRKFVK